MNASQLEALVIRAVDSVRRGEGNEDDRIEFKREWPTGKARQLAGAANQADGEDLVYVIGFDERDGSIHPTSGTDAADWWAQNEAQFDAVAPDLVRHLVVQVAEGESVTALHFRTDRRPYVVKAQGGGGEREVPIRAGTRTRSAYRHELIRMLYPVSASPQITLISASLTLGPDSYSGDTALRFWGSLYFEVPDGAKAFLPSHGSRAFAEADPLQWNSPIGFSGAKSDHDSPISVRWDGLQLNASGVVHAEASWVLGPEQTAAQLATPDWRIRLSFARANASRTLVVDAHMGRRRAVEVPIYVGSEERKEGGAEWFVVR